MERTLKFFTWEIVDDTFVKVRAEHVLTSPMGVPVSGMIPCQITLLFRPDSSVAVESCIYAPSSLPPLPRAGLTFALSSEYSAVEHCGLGPYEVYPDRMAAAYLGVFSHTVEELHTPYIVPQENGRRASPRHYISSIYHRTVLLVSSVFLFRWLKFLNEDRKSGLQVVPSYGEGMPVEDFGWSASYYNTDTLDKCLHDYELTRDAESNVYVHLDSKMMGLGGYDGWSPNVEKEFLIEMGQMIRTDVVLSLSCI